MEPAAQNSASERGELVNAAPWWLANKLFGASLIIVLAMAAGCGHQTSIRYECPSPDGRWIATFYGMSGGGAAGWAYQYAKVRPSDETFRDEPWLLQLAAARDARLIWQDAKHLRIEYPDSARLDHKQDRFSEDDVTISVSYRALPSGDKGFREGVGGCGASASKAVP